MSRDSCPVTRRASRAFTLLELLIVISIISILVGLITPALNTVKNNAKKQKTSVQSANLGTALKAYYNEYGWWPNVAPPGNYTADRELTVSESQNLYLMLGSGNIWLNGTPGGNPKRIAFLTYNNSDLGPVAATFLISPGGATTNLVNPWGYAHRMTFDYNGDNMIVPTPPLPGYTAGNGPNRGYAIWSIGLGVTWTNRSWW